MDVSRKDKGVVEQKRPNQNRILWLVLGGLGGLAVIMICAVVFLASFFMINSRTSTGAEMSSRTTERQDTPQAVVPAATPVPAQVVVPDVTTDYESAMLMNVYQKVGPSVVNVEVLALGKNILQPFPDLENVDPNNLFPQGQGSGFVWDTEGHIVTNAHVVADADQVQVKFYDGTIDVAEVIGVDPHSDLAVLSIDPAGYNLVPVKRGNLDEMRVGMRVAAIGNPFGFEGTLTSGIVSAIGRSIPAVTSFNIPEAIQTDAAINPGNSGGPLLNEKGEVIGVNAQIRSDERANSGVGFAIPITIVDRVVPALIREGSYEHSYIGVSGVTFSPICSDALGLSKDLRGAYIVEVLPGTPAADAGLRGGSEESDSNLVGICPSVVGGDLIVAIDGQPVTQFDDLLIYLERYTSPGDTIELTVLRDGQEIPIEVTLTARPDVASP